ncbi:MAG: UDP-3-O-(3-hydroxymyristoyl)glucosamine N-acyltransferase [Lentisphaerae bacterium]|nr:UDP-3-O-(3-hydroxymyristoyl)glucosamine N-acyltransferase [Lentisphaerota bacterium]
MKMTVEEIAVRLGASFDGNPSAVVERVAGIRDAEAGEISFVANPKYAHAASETRATAVIVEPSWAHPCPASLIRAANPEQAFSRVAEWFAPPPVTFEPGIHPSAVVAPDAIIGSGSYIGPHVVIESGASIGARCVLVAGCYIGHGASAGDDCRFYPNVTIREHCRIGSRVILHNGVVIGSDGFGYAQEGAARRKIPQIGIVVIGDDVEIGANTTVDRARFGRTRIGNGVKIDNLVQIAHNVTIGDNAVIVAQVGIAGSSSIGARTILAGQVGVAGHLTICDDVIVGAQSGVSKDIENRGMYLGSPALPFDKATKLIAHMSRMSNLKERVAGLENRLAAIEAKAAKAKS